MSETPWITVGIVADVEPNGAWPDVAAMVATEMLSARLADAAVLRFTCRTPTALDVGRPAWASLDRLAAAAPDAVIACGSSASTAAERTVPGAVVVGGPELDRSCGLAAMLPHLLDPVALGVRRRMLAHLGVLPAGDYTLDDDLLAATSARFPLRPADLHLLAAGASAITCTDWLPGELAGDAPTDAAMSLVAAWADDLLARLPERSAGRLAALSAEVAELRGLLARERAEHEADIERLAERVERAEAAAAER